MDAAASPNKTTDLGLGTAANNLNLSYLIATVLSM